MDNVVLSARDLTAIGLILELNFRKAKPNYDMMNRGEGVTGASMVVQSVGADGTASLLSQ
jgi:hypothetical protein